MLEVIALWLFFDGCTFCKLHSSIFCDIYFHDILHRFVAPKIDFFSVGDHAKYKQTFWAAITPTPTPVDVTAQLGALIFWQSAGATRD